MASWLENIFCQTPLKNAADLQAQVNQVNGDLINAKLSLNAAQANYASCVASIPPTMQKFQDQINTLNAQIAAEQAKTAQCTAQLAAAQNKPSLYQKPIPALISAVPGSKVMLGQFVLTNATGTHYLTYPSHGAIFFPCPIYEGILNSCDCNRVRSDLTPIEICMKIANVLQRQMRYISDQAQWNALDCWAPAPVVLMLGQDDCESLTQNICSAIMYYEQKFGCFATHSVFCGLGHLIEGTNSYGHSFVVALHHTSTALSDSYIIEATLNFEVSPMTLAEASTTYQIDWNLIGFPNIANMEGSWMMLPSFSWWNTQTQATGASPKEGRLHRFMRKLLRQKGEGDKKGELINRIWEAKRKK